MSTPRWKLSIAMSRDAKVDLLGGLAVNSVILGLDLTIYRHPRFSNTTKYLSMNPRRDSSLIILSSSSEVKSYT